jgi:hypothetical protein
MRVFLLFALFISLKAFAYPNFIGHGYTSCLTCHYNPLGNGPLNDYGRAVGASAIAARHFADPKKSDEKLAEESGFMHSKPSNKWFRPGIDYRGLAYISQFGKDSQKDRYITMDANVNAVAKFGKADNFLISATAGFSPRQPGTDDEEVRSREHYIGWRINPQNGIYIGLMDKAFGIRVPDHIAFSRTLTRNTQNDQTHGMMYHRTTNKYDLAVHAFTGNQFEDETTNGESTKQVGGSVYFEYSTTKSTRHGGSILKSASDFLDITAISGHTRMGFGKGSSLMAELGYVNKTPKNPAVASQKDEGIYGFLQGHIRINRGFYFMTTAEYSKGDLARSTEQIIVAPGFQYFPHKGYEFRMDLRQTKILSNDYAVEDRWDVLAQLHVWL